MAATDSLPASRRRLLRLVRQLCAAPASAEDPLPHGGALSPEIHSSQMSVEEALLTRKSVRHFDASQHVPRSVVEKILEAANRAPSDQNIQQWRVYVVAHTVRDALVREATADRKANGKPPIRLPLPMDPTDPDSKPRRTPKTYPQIYRERSRANGRQYYGSIGIMGNREAGSIQQIKNYEFFGAPVGIFIYTNLNYLNSWRDCGMFIQSIMLAARGHGLHTIAQGAWTNYDALVRKYTGAPETETLICGMGLGYEVPGDPVNQFVTDRAPVAEFATILGYD